MYITITGWKKNDELLSGELGTKIGNHNHTYLQESSAQTWFHLDHHASPLRFPPKMNSNMVGKMFVWMHCPAHGKVLTKLLVLFITKLSFNPDTCQEVKSDYPKLKWHYYQFIHLPSHPINLVSGRYSEVYQYCTECYGTPGPRLHCRLVYTILNVE